MRLRRISASVATVAAVGLVLTACAPPESGETGDAGTDTTAPQAASVTVSATVGPNEFISYNGFTPESYSTYNSAIADQLLIGFTYFEPDGSIAKNTDLGDYELVSEDPLTIKYTINDNAVWSDGEPITVADVVFAWGVQNADIKAGDAPLFNSVSQDMGIDVPTGPEGDIAGKEFTVQFANKNPDWQLATWLLHPAHVVADQAGLTKEELAQAVLDKDAAKLQPAADFWNISDASAWKTAPGTLPDPALVPSSGPYVLSSWEAGQSVTLKANPNYYGELLAPKNSELVIRFIAQDSMVQALDNEDVDVIAPQPLVDTVAQLEALGDKVQILAGSTMTWEHLDFNFREGSLFADDLNLRKAFAMCVPREQIVENLIKPVFPEAAVLNARERFNFQPDYQELVDAAYDGSYDTVDIEGAKALVEAAGKTGAEVRIGYSAPNPRRTDEVALIKDSCDQAGFNIVDAGNEDFFAPGGTQERGDYEVALFAWAGSGQIASGENIYATGKPQNYGQYSNPEVDAAWTALKASLDPAVHMEQYKVIEKLLWDDLFGIPVFAHPGVDAASAKIQNVEHTATQSGIVWNAYAWSRAE